MGKKGVENGVFRGFLKNGSNDFVFFPTERRYYNDSLVCQVTSPEKFSFSRYGLKGGRKWGFSRFSENLDSRFGSISYKRKISSFYMFVSSFESRPFFVLEIWGKRGSKMSFFGIISKMALTISFFFLQKEDITKIH